jgi:putative sigma-54 modulation protein
MVVHLAGRGGVTVSPELRRRILAKITKVERLLPKLGEARIVLATERYRHLAEVTLRGKRATFHVEGEASDFQAALDQALATLTAQIRRKKERAIGKKPRPSSLRAARPPGPGGPPEPVDDSPSVLVRRTNAKPMSLEEAIEQLRLQADGLLVFRNARTRTVSVLRRRADGAVELVEPAG